jgi:hypothetical protein
LGLFLPKRASKREIGIAIRDLEEFNGERWKGTIPGFSGEILREGIKGGIERGVQKGDPKGEPKRGVQKGDPKGRPERGAFKNLPRG